MTPPLAILRGNERNAWLSGPRDVIDAIATAANLPARDCADVAAWVAAESTAAKAAHAAARGTRHADVASMLWASVEATEAAFALWRRARGVIERCGRAEARRAVTPSPDAA